MSSNTCVLIVSAVFMYGGVTVIVSREILTNNLCKRLLNIRGRLFEGRLA